MKHLMKIFVILIGVSFLLAPFSVLDASEKKAEKVEKAEKKETKLCCVVCENHIAEGAAKFKAEYKGKTFYFNTEKCKAEFEKNPEKYQKCCEGKVSYVCPMKQCNVKSDKPGKCPKCGMDLKKVVKHSECCKHKEDHKEHKDHKHEHKGDHTHQHKH